MEYFDVVDERDRVIGKASREECHRNPGLIHRATNIFVFDSPDLKRLLRVKRSRFVDTEKDRWTILIGEHNKIGEDYTHAIKRGLREEIGIDDDITIKKLGKKVICRMKNQTEIQQNFIGIYRGSLEKLAIDNNEIATVEFISIPKLLKDIKDNRDAYVSYIDIAWDIIFSHLKKNVKKKKTEKKA